MKTVCHPERKLFCHPERSEGPYGCRLPRVSHLRPGSRAKRAACLAAVRDPLSAAFLITDHCSLFSAPGAPRPCGWGRGYRAKRDAFLAAIRHPLSAVFLAAIRYPLSPVFLFPVPYSLVPAQPGAPRPSGWGRGYRAKRDAFLAAIRHPLSAVFLAAIRYPLSAVFLFPVPYSLVPAQPGAPRPSGWGRGYRAKRDAFLAAIRYPLSAFPTTAPGARCPAPGALVPAQLLRSCA